VSRQIIEQVTNAKPKGQEFYNCSDGAKIQGALPIRPDELLIVVTENQKTQIVEKLKTKIFMTKELSNYSEKFEKQFSQKLLIEELSALQTLLEKDVTCKEDIELVINKQKEMLFTSYKNGNSLLFYYLYGTVNYANAVLSKLLYLKGESDNQFLKSNLLIDKWSNTLCDIKDSLQNEYSSLDHSTFRQGIRENIVLERHLINRKILIITNSLSFAKSCKWLIENNMKFIKHATITSYEQRDFDSNYDYVIYYDQERIRGKVGTAAEPKLNVLGEINTLVIVDGLSFGVDMDIKEKVVTCILPSELNQGNGIILNCLILASISLKACIEVSRGHLIIPRINTIKGEPFNLVDIYNKSPLITKFCKAIKFTYYSVIFEENLTKQAYLSNSGSRGEFAANLNNSSVYTNQQITREQLDEASKIYEIKIPELFDNAIFSSQINIINK
jgi:hypothetical protein